jgi:hypothetical protein
MNVHLKESVKTSPTFRQLKELAELERRSLAGMVWLLVLEALQARQKQPKGGK